MTCATCGCPILIGEAFVGGGGACHHAEPQTCIKALVSALGWSRHETRRHVAMLRAMSPVVYAARIVRVRDWQRKRAHRQRSEAAIRDAQYRLEESVARIYAAIAAYLRGDAR